MKILNFRKRDDELGIRQQELKLEHRHAQLKEQLNTRLSCSSEYGFNLKSFLSCSSKKKRVSFLIYFIKLLMDFSRGTLSFSSLWTSRWTMFRFL